MYFTNQNQTNMKLKLILAVVILAASVVVLMSFDNTDKPEVEQYCEVIAMSKFLSRKVTIDVNYGEERKLFSFADTRVKDDAGKVKSFNSVVDAMNFMGQRGWILINAFPESTGNQSIYHYVFKKTFSKEEVDKVEGN